MTAPTTCQLHGCHQNDGKVTCEDVDVLISLCLLDFLMIASAMKTDIASIAVVGITAVSHAAALPSHAHKSSACETVMSASSPDAIMSVVTFGVF